MASLTDRREPAASLWTLPGVVEVQAERVRYSSPRTYFLGPERHEATEAVEFHVRTDGPLPVRALSPALYVGDLPLLEYETTGPGRYRYFAFEPNRLVAGSPLSLGWPERPELRAATGFSYRPPTG